MMIDTGEKLNITYTTDSLLVTTSTDGHTSVIIAKLPTELPCGPPNNGATNSSVSLLIVIWACVIVVVFMNGYVVAIHLMFKELRSSFIGKLLLLYCLAIACMAIGVATKMVMSLQTGRIQLVCHFLSFFILLDAVSFDCLATCILHGFAYIVYRTNKLQQISKGESKTLFR